MRKTPETVSRARQRLGAEIEVWRAGIAAARRDISLDVNTPAENLAKVKFGNGQIALCKKELAKLSHKGKPRFWPKEN